MSNVPWFLPGLALSVALAYAISLRVRRRFGGSRAVTWIFLASAGMILSATLTPLRDVLESGAVGAGGCDLSRLGPPPVGLLLEVNDVTLNVLLFIPLGIAIGLVPTLRSRVILLGVGVIAPFAIETIQSFAPILGRGCESADVVDNLSGLVIGALGGALARRWLVRHEARPPTPPHSISGT